MDEEESMRMAEKMLKSRFRLRGLPQPDEADEKTGLHGIDRQNASRAWEMFRSGTKRKQRMGQGMKRSFFR